MPGPDVAAHATVHHKADGPTESDRAGPESDLAPLKVVVLVSGSGTLLQALLDDSTGPAPSAYRIVAVGADRHHARALDRARRAGAPTFICRPTDHPDRPAWDAALAEKCAPADLVVLAGFLKLLGPVFLQRFPGRVINSHPSLLPAFPGLRAPADALARGVKVSGGTVFVVDEGVDTGKIVAQRAVEVRSGDDPHSLHERIKVAERDMLVDVVRLWAVHGPRTGPRPRTPPISSPADPLTEHPNEQRTDP